MKGTAAALALLAGLPVGWITSVLLTPLLWRLEPILYTDPAGHSGPSDWVFYLVWAVVVPASFSVQIQISFDDHKLD